VTSKNTNKAVREDTRIIDLYVKTSDNYQLATSHFIPSVPVKGIILVASATAVKRQYYYHFAKFLASQGYVTVCFDYRGIGGSLYDNIKFLKANIRDWGEKDLNTMINWSKVTYPLQSLHLVCHSIGGQLLALSKDNYKADSILHCSVQSGYWTLWKEFLTWINNNN